MVALSINEKSVFMLLVTNLLSFKHLHAKFQLNILPKKLILREYDSLRNYF